MERAPSELVQSASPDLFQAILEKKSKPCSGTVEKGTTPSESNNNPNMGVLKFFSALQKKIEESKEPIERGLRYSYPAIGCTRSYPRDGIGVSPKCMNTQYK